MTAIACLHLAAFPAWACQQLSPGDADVVVHDGERVVAGSLRLRSAGLTAGLSLERARQLFPDAGVHLRDPRGERVIWEDILHLLSELSSRLEPLAPGWVLLDPDDRSGLRRVARTLGARVGITPQRFTSALTALRGRDGDVIELTGAGARRILDDVPVGSLAELGFEAAAVDMLLRTGLARLGDVWKLTRRNLAARLGQDGERLFRLLHPEGEEPPVPEFQPPPSVSVGHDFDHPTADPDGLLPALDELVHRGAAELAGYQAQLMTLRLVGRDARGARSNRRMLKTPASRPYPLFVAAEAMLRTMLAGGAPVARIVLELGGLSQPAGVQGNLLFEPHDDFEAVRSLHRRNPGLSMRAVATDPEASATDASATDALPAGVSATGTEVFSELRFDGAMSRSGTRSVIRRGAGEEGGERRELA